MAVVDWIEQYWRICRWVGSVGACAEPVRDGVGERACGRSADGAAKNKHKFASKFAANESDCSVGNGTNGADGANATDRAAGTADDHADTVAAFDDADRTAAEGTHRWVVTKMDTLEFEAMNTHVLLAAEGDAAQVAQGLAWARAQIWKREAQFTRFRETSELCALNRASGSWFNASPELYEVMQAAYALHEETDGLFDPSILNALERTGYAASFEYVRGGEIAPFIVGGSGEAEFRGVNFHAGQRAIWMPAGMRIDLGGIAKGWIAQEAARGLAEFAEACVVNAGGDMVMVGVPQGQTAWEIEIEDPRDATQTLAVLHAPAGAVATSSVMKRRWKQGEQTRHHLIDPRTRLAVDTDWLSVTVLAQEATVAEVYAKTLLIAGSKEAEKLATRRDGIEFVAVDGDGQFWGSERVKELIYAIGE